MVLFCSATAALIRFSLAITLKDVKLWCKVNKSLREAVIYPQKVIHKSEYSIKNYKCQQKKVLFSQIILNLLLFVIWNNAERFWKVQEPTL